jgi:hypothetical protein
MKFIKASIVVSSIAFSGAALAGTTASTASAPVTLVVPAYFDAARGVANWDALTATARRIPTTAILNPNSGPGVTADANYTAAIARLRAAGGKVIGYVSTSYTKRSLSAVVADINRYIALYAVDGFFIDEMTADNEASHIQFYQSVYNYIKGLKPTYTVIGNPGTNIPELYASLPTADQFVVFESNARSYANYQTMGWQAAYPKSRFVHIVYNVSAAHLQRVVTYAKTHGAGSLYVTSFTLPNPYKALPAYWNSEVADALAP